MILNFNDVSYKPSCEKDKIKMWQLFVRYKNTVRTGGWIIRLTSNIEDCKQTSKVVKVQYNKRLI